MSDEDSGCDAGSDTNESVSMSVGSSAPSEHEETVEGNLPYDANVQFERERSADEDTDASRGQIFQFNPFGMESICLPSASINFSCLNTVAEDLDGEEQHDLMVKMRPNFRKRLSMRWKSILDDRCTIARKLRMACNMNDSDSVHSLLNQGVDPTVRDERGRTPLHFAACKGYTPIVKLLLERGADPNQQDVIGNTALHLAACTSHVDVVTLLLKHGANINTFDKSGRTPLHLAKSKLKLLHDSKSYSSSQVKDIVLQIIEMMQIYLQRSGKVHESDLLNAFTSRLRLHQTKEEVDHDVEDLLSSISHLSL